MPEKIHVIQTIVPMCPLCNGAIHHAPHSVFLRCWDCNAVFRVDKEGLTEREFICIHVNPQYTKQG